MKNLISKEFLQVWSREKKETLKHVHSRTKQGVAIKKNHDTLYIEKEKEGTLHSWVYM